LYKKKKEKKKSKEKKKKRKIRYIFKAILITTSRLKKNKGIA
jgi:hypothetical protein